MCRLANALKALGVAQGRPGQHLPGHGARAARSRCSRARASAPPHSVVFGGFSSDSLRDRIQDAEAKVLITGDGAWRRGSVVPLKETADDAVAECPSIEKVLVLRRTAHDVPMTDGRDVWWHDLVPQQSAECAPEPMDAEDLLYLLYTSGTTAQAQGHHAHDRRLPHAGGVDAQVRLRPPPRHRRLLVRGRRRLGHRPLVHRLRPAREPRDERALRGHARLSRTRTGSGRSSSSYGVTILYTAPTAIRTFMKWGPEFPEAHDLSSLRLLGTVGEPINPEAWVWYWQHIGGERCPVVDTWWQTETGAIMISPLPGVTTLKPGQRDVPASRRSAPTSSTTPASRSTIPGGGYLVLTRPWPSMLRGIWGDPERYRDTYWSRFDGRYFAGDGAKRDDDGYYWLLGRVDDVMLVSGHNISTAEVEHALVGHPAVAEAAVVGTKDATTGQAISAFVILRGGNEPSDALVAELRDHVGAAPSARSPSRRRSCSPRTCRRPARARSCAGCCATSPRTRRSATPRRSPTRRSSRASRRATSPPRAPTTSERAPDRLRPRALDLARRAGRAGPGGGRRHRRRALRRRQPPALPRGAAPRLGRVLRGVR